MMGRGAKWSCLLKEVVLPGRALREALVALLCTTLTKAPAIVNEAADVCVVKNMGVVVAREQMRNRQSTDNEI
jgi:hypothetical protein